MTFNRKPLLPEPHPESCLIIEVDHRPTRDEEGQADQEGGGHTLGVVEDGRHEV